ncbi:MAG: Hsp20/alpha crystallin family protein [Flavobacteriaceae bacterium]
MNLVRKQRNSFSPSLVNEWLTNDWLQPYSFENKQLPAVNIQEMDQAFLVELVAPGLKKEDLQVEVEKDVLSIASEAEGKTEETGRYTRKEYNFASFRRTFSIPESVDSKKIDALYSEGVLTVTLPKRKEAVQEPKKSIRIR